jgi:dihydrofolate synthase/folylpolyglutamate synthase
MRALLRALASPHKKYRTIIVSGTNGKGSTSATITSILTESGYRTGHYTSPHLVDIRERWTIDGNPIDAALLRRAIVRLQEGSARADILPTYFEALTLIAFIAFADARCEIVVLEVGMGGRLDATNVTRPLAALITPISFDHTEYLGNTLRKIAAEKAGVIHRGTIALTSNEDPAVVGVLRRRAERFGNAFVHVKGEHDTPLHGAFQRRNTALAVRAAKELRPTLRRITPRSIERGVARTQWRGRLEHLRVDGKDIWIDGGHNLHAAKAIAPYIDAKLRRPRMLVFGIMSDKDVASVTRELFPLFDEIVCCDPYTPRAANVDDLVALADGNAVAVRDPRRALESAMASRYRTILVCGSLYLAGAAIEYFDAKRGGRRHKKK